MTEHRIARREMLKGVTAAAGTMALPWRIFGADSRNSRVRVYMTSDTKKHQEVGSAVWTPLRNTRAGAESDTIQVDTGTAFQTMLGFGSALTDASCFLLNSMKPDARQTLLTETYSPRRMNLGVGRTSIGASDYSQSLYSYDDTPDDVTMQHFSIAHDETYILPILREVRRIHPDLFLLASPWSPPGWMKTYGSMLGGWMTHKYLVPYALYLSRFLEAYSAAGVPINAITCQNELETDQGGHMPATYWTPEMESDFIRDHLGPLLRQKKSPSKIWLLDHNYELWKRVRWQMQDAALRQYVSGVAWHGYVGTPDQMSRLHEVYPDLPFYWTEGGPDVNDPKYGVEWTRWGTIFTAAIRNWCRCIITWNLILDPRGAPNIGPFQCGGLMTLRDNGGIDYSGQYWTLRHFSQHVSRESVRVASHSDASELSHVAFAHPSGGYALIVTNTGEEREIRIVTNTVESTVKVDRNSITSLVW